MREGIFPPKFGIGRCAKRDKYRAHGKPPSGTNTGFPDSSQAAYLLDPPSGANTGPRQAG
ncbi:hypothetical protein HMPREF9080_01197 [Cardiobacterium valvarum F0432]|uniref:Uncharacterized protein n=1 Tax=Cardiobacterium valvarum F0432 TaxID=797473 RepID=G9ZEL7_9GAMM|nr:hypothetical protein HMPREF9080_01197 [Cardiobacterium valvarum F0432]